MCGSIANSGGYCNKTNDAMINQTLTSSDLQAMYTWQDYLAPQLPVEWQPNGVYAADARSPTTCTASCRRRRRLTINPENWYFVK